jgi:hypothetical protein
MQGQQNYSIYLFNKAYFHFSFNLKRNLVRKSIFNPILNEI